MTKVVHDTDVGTGLEIAGGKLGVAGSMATDAELAAAIAAVTGGGTEPNLVFVDTNDPNTATVFDDENPPVTNDPLLAQDSQYLYVGADGSQWTWNGTAYITSPQNTTVGAGSSAAITRVFPVATNGVLLSASATGLFTFDGLRFDIKWWSISSYYITLVNTTASTITLNHNSRSNINNTMVSGTATTVAAGASLRLAEVLWSTTGLGDSITNVVINNRWYVLRSVAYPIGAPASPRMVIMALERKV